MTYFSNVLRKPYYMLALLCLVFTFTAKAQTKQETIDWLNSKANHQFVYGEIFKTSKKFKFNNDGSFEIISTNYEVPFNHFKPQAACVTTLKGHFKNLSPTSVRTRIVEGLIFVDIKCSNSSKCIQTTQAGDCGTFDITGITFGAFDDIEENIEARLKKAFIHIINLYGGKKEVF